MNSYIAFSYHFARCTLQHNLSCFVCVEAARLKQNNLLEHTRGSVPVFYVRKVGER